MTDLDVGDHQLTKSIRSDVKLAGLEGTGLVGLVCSEDTVLVLAAVLVMMEQTRLPVGFGGKEAAQGCGCPRPLHYTDHRAFPSDQRCEVE